MQPLPILYSFRRCPYAMRARLALQAASIKVELREVALRQKPAAMLSISPKGTVPVLQIDNGKVIAESLDIMHWALQQNDPENWLPPASTPAAHELINTNDNEFKAWLDRYKYADRYPEHPQAYYRQQAEQFLATLESRLQQTPYLSTAHFSLTDAAILPFIRQFAAVDASWFQQAPYPLLTAWLQNFTNSARFTAIMHNYSAWQPGDPPTRFPSEP